jgi:transcriptional regulator with XRE-family HTH domain
MLFGDFIKQLRAKKRIGLREFCLALEFDPSHWSKVERGLANPPKDQDVLARIAQLLDVKVGSDDWTRLTDLAALSRGRIPDDLLKDKELLASLPLVFRNLRREPPTKDELNEVVDLVSHS